MNPLPTRLNPFLLVLATALAVFAGGACAQSTTPRSSAAPAPPADASEETVRSADGRAAAALIVSAAQIRPGENVKVQIANRGGITLGHGRPVIVERWTGSAWEETPESRNSAWTMELLHVEPGRSGVEQTWPFQPTPRPSPGWYRLSKDLYAGNGGGNPEQLIVRARVEVVGP